MYSPSINVSLPICDLAAPGTSIAAVLSAPLNAVLGIANRVAALSSLIRCGELRNSAIGSCFRLLAFSAAFLRPFGISSSCSTFSLSRFRISGVRPSTLTVSRSRRISGTSISVLFVVAICHSPKLMRHSHRSGLSLTTENGLPCHNSPHLALPDPASPRLPCHTVPHPASPSIAAPRLPCQATPGRSVPLLAGTRIAMPRLPRTGCLRLPARGAV